MSIDTSTVVAVTTSVVAFWVVERGTAEFIQTNQTPTSCAISYNGQRAATTHKDGTLRLWDVPARRCVSTLFLGHATECNVFGEKVLVVLSRRKRSEIVCISWDAVGIKKPRRFSHMGQISCLSASTHQGIMAAAYKHKDCRAEGASLMIRSFRDGSRARLVYASILGPLDCITVAVAEYAPFILCSDLKGLRLYHATIPRLDVVLKKSFEFGPRIATISADATRVVDVSPSALRIWNVSERSCVAIIPTAAPIRALTLSPEGNIAILSTTERNICAIDTSEMWNNGTEESNSDDACCDGHSSKESDDEDSKFCPICQSKVEIREKVIALPCGHIFHYECISRYLRKERRPRCPLDRHIIPAWTLQYLPVWNWEGKL